jgi:hypothetical protein
MARRNHPLHDNVPRVMETRTDGGIHEALHVYRLDGHRANL